MQPAGRRACSLPGGRRPATWWLMRLVFLRPTERPYSQSGASPRSWPSLVTPSSRFRGRGCIDRNLTASGYGSAAGAVHRGLLGGRLAASPKLLDQSNQIAVLRSSQGELLCVFERRFEIANFAMEAD